MNGIIFYILCRKAKRDASSFNQVCFIFGRLKKVKPFHFKKQNLASNKTTGLTCFCVSRILKKMINTIMKNMSI
jgi:hypothetical protein